MSATPPRRVVTGHDATGRSVVLSDGATPTTHVFPTGAIFHEIWSTAAVPAPVGAGEPDEPTTGPLRVPPGPLGTIVHVIDMPPGSSAPIHRTRSIDFEAERIGRFVQPTRGDLVAEHHPHSSASRRHRVP